jgi:transposase
MRGERVERSFAHLYETGGMRRTHLRGHSNILKRLLIHAGAFNLGRLLRHLVGVGTPRSLQGGSGRILHLLLGLYRALRPLLFTGTGMRIHAGLRRPQSRSRVAAAFGRPFTTGC